LVIVALIRPYEKNVAAVVSRHKDGEVIARALKKSGFSLIRGSTNRKADERPDRPSKDRGGMQALRESIRFLKKGYGIGITPDGPRGPNQIYKTNALTLAAMSGAPILPLAYSCNRGLVFNSWDKFMIPTPFSKIVIIFGNLQKIDKGASKEDIEKYGKLIEKVKKILKGSPSVLESLACQGLRVLWFGFMQLA